MEQLFKALPQDLQWEVLSEFVGTHTVRRGHLRRKLVLGPEYQSVMTRSTVFKTIDPFWHSYTKPVTYVSLKWGRRIECYQCPKGEDTHYHYVSPLDATKPYSCGTVVRTVHPPRNSVALPPFEKHSYPSYEHTDKKQRNRLNLYS